MRVMQRAARRRRLLALVIGLLLLVGGLGYWQARARQVGKRAPFDRFLEEFLAPGQQVAGTLRNAASPDPQYTVDPLTPVGLERLRAAEEENARLRKLLELRDTTVKGAKTAEVISREGYLVLNKGRAEGVETSMVVLTPDGVLGQVTAVNSHTADVLPLTDSTSGIGAVTMRGRAFGVLNGGQDGRCRMEYVAGSADIQPGDIVVTSGLSRIFPAGLPLGTVESVTNGTAVSSRIAFIAPAANPAQAEFVLLVKYQ